MLKTQKPQKINPQYGDKIEKNRKSQDKRYFSIISLFFLLFIERRKFTLLLVGNMMDYPNNIYSKCGTGEIIRANAKTLQPKFRYNSRLLYRVNQLIFPVNAGLCGRGLWPSLPRLWRRQY